MLLDDILTRLRSDTLLADVYGVRALAVFGSVARGDAGPQSDIDILVDYRGDVHPDLFDFLHLRDHLERLCGRKVDLATRDALHPDLRDHILSEAVYA